MRFRRTSRCAAALKNLSQSLRSKLTSLANKLTRISCPNRQTSRHLDKLQACKARKLQQCQGKQGCKRARLRDDVVCRLEHNEFVLQQKSDVTCSQRKPEYVKQSVT